MKKRLLVVLGVGLLMVGSAMALQTTISPSLSYMLMTDGTHVGMYFTNYYYGAHPVTFLKYDLSTIAVPAGRILQVDNATWQNGYNASGTTDFSDGLWTRNDSFDTTTTWATRGTRGDLLATWAFVPWTQLTITNEDLTAYVQSQADSDNVASFWMEDYDGNGASGSYHNYYGSSYPDLDFKLNLTYTLMPTDTSNRFANPRFDNVSAQGLPNLWGLWFDNASDSATVDNTTFRILPFNKRNVLSFNIVDTSWGCFYKTIPVLGGVPYRFSMTHREIPDFNWAMCVLLSGPNTPSQYLTTEVYGSTTWTVWSAVFTPAVDDNLTITVYPRGKGPILFGEMSCKPDVRDTTPTGPVAPLGTDNITWSRLADNISTWSSDNLTVSYTGGKCVATVAGGYTYGRLGPVDLPVDKTHAPFLTIQVQQDNLAGGFAVVVDGQPLDILSYNDETGSPRIQPRDVPGIVTYDLRKFSGVRDNTNVPLQIYVAGTSKQVTLSWVKLANRPLPATVDIDTGSDYLVFHLPVFTINDYNTLPAPGDNGTLAVTMCRNQTESSSFCVYSRTALSGVNVTVSDLTSGGNTIPSSAIDVRAVKVWYQQGSLTLTPTGTVLEPELLLHNDALITVNRDNQTNTLNFADLPQDNSTLQALTIDANTTKEFWLTINPADNLPAGTYTGTITVSTSNGTPSSTVLPLSVTVLPFDLQGPGRTTAIYGNPDTDAIAQNLSSHGISGIIMDNFHQYVGVSGTSPNYTYDFSNVTPVIDRMVNAGLVGPVVIVPCWISSMYNVVYGGYEGPTPTLAQVQAGLSADQQTIFNDFLTQLKSYWNGRYPTIPFWMHLEDEPSYILDSANDFLKKRFWRSVHLLNLVHAAGLEGYTTPLDWETQAAFDNASIATSPPLDYPNYTQPMIDAIVRYDSFPANYRPGLYYPHPNEHPVYNRAIMGLYCWYSVSAGFCPWTYMCDNSALAYNDTHNWVGCGRYAGYVYPAQNGTVIDTIEWEAVLAAVNDLRYLNTLQYCVDQTSGMTGSTITPLRSDSQTLLNTIPAFISGKYILGVAGTVTPQQLQTFRDNITAKLNQWCVPLASDATLNVNEGGQASCTVVGKFLGNGGGTGTYSIVSNPGKGTVTIDNVTGVCFYTHTNASTGSDSFTYKYRVNGVDSNTATVSVNIAAWTNVAIGTSSGGSKSRTGTVFTVGGKGGGITGTADSFYFVYKSVTVSDNFSMTARVTDVSGTTRTNTRAGVMIRQSTAAGNKEVSSLYKPYSTKQYYFHYRTASGGTTATSYVAAGTSSPWWVRVTHTNSGGSHIFRAYKSNDGSSWSQVGSDRTFSMTDNVTVGLAVTSGSTSATNTATFDNVTLTK